jgi:hypothetical protein
MLATKKYLLPLSLLALLLCGPLAARAQQTTRVWALSLKLQKDSEKKPVARKHFYVFYAPAPDAKKLTKEQFFKNLVAAVGPPPTLQTYQAELVKSGVSEAQAKEFINHWILKYRCETIYCQDVAPDDLTRVSLFKTAHDANAPLFAKTSDAATRSFRWLPNFLPAAIRTGYYDLRRKWSRCATAYMTAPPDKNGLGMVVQPGTTNKDGSTYFPRLPSGTMYLSNLAPLEIGPDLSKVTMDLWFVVQEIKPTTVSGKVETNGKAKDRVEAKDLQSAAAPTFRCEQ